MDHHYYLLQNQMDIFGARVDFTSNDSFETWHSCFHPASSIQG